MTPVIDLNADVGEGFGVWRLGNDAALMSVITSANVACGFHAGDPSQMRMVCELAVKHGVTIGAQVGYRDLAGFGRRYVEMDPGELADDLLYQMGALQAMAQAAGGYVSYVKPHGALYNAAVANAEVAGAIVSAAGSFDDALPILSLPGSQTLRLAGSRGVPEAFADRAYRSDGTLVPRSESGAVLTDPDVIARRSVAMAIDHRCTATDGSTFALNARSLCVHGDTPGAVEIAKRVRTALEEAGRDVAPFATPPR